MGYIVRRIFIQEIHELRSHIENGNDKVKILNVAHFNDTMSESPKSSVMVETDWHRTDSGRVYLFCQVDEKIVVFDSICSRDPTAMASKRRRDIVALSSA